MFTMDTEPTAGDGAPLLLLGGNSAILVLVDGVDVALNGRFDIVSEPSAGVMTYWVLAGLASCLVSRR